MAPAGEVTARVLVQDHLWRHSIITPNEGERRQEEPETYRNECLRGRRSEWTGDLEAEEAPRGHDSHKFDYWTLDGGRKNKSPAP